MDLPLVFILIVLQFDKSTQVLGVLYVKWNNFMPSNLQAVIMNSKFCFTFYKYISAIHHFFDCVLHFYIVWALPLSGTMIVVFSLYKYLLVFREMAYGTE